MAVFWPNEKDRRLLQWVLDEVRNTSRNRPAVGGGPRTMQPTASSYVALVPPSGIPALTYDKQAGTGTSESGTGTGTGTGSESGPTVARPGYAECEIYQIVQGDDFATTQEHVLKKIGRKLTVYNTTSEKIEHEYTLISQVKGGKWVVGAGGGSGSGSVLFFEGFLTEDLVPPQYGTDPPTAADVHVYERKLEFGFPEPLVPVMTPGPEGEEPWVVPCWTSDPFLSAPAGSYCQFTRVQGLEDSYYIITYLSCDSALPPGTGTGT